MSAIPAEIIRYLYGGPKYTIEDVFDFFKKYEKDKMKTAIKNLERYEFIRQKRNYDGSVIVSLSEKGRLRALSKIFERFDRKKEKWDGKWRMVAFDIPNFSTKGRKALVYRLKIGGFYELQESIFLHPYNCEKEIKALANLFKIDKYIRFGLIELIDNRKIIVRHFKLRNLI
jgi:DNA-binding transcriptional regulator PaaX